MVIFINIIIIIIIFFFYDKNKQLLNEIVFKFTLVNIYSVINLFFEFCYFLLVNLNESYTNISTS